MRMPHLLIACIAVVSFAACDGRRTEAPAGATAPAPTAPSKDAKQPGPEITGESRLVKVSTSDSVFVLKDGKISAIASWSWVERNAAGKPIEVITQQEPQSHPGSGILYK